MPKRESLNAAALVIALIAHAQTVIAEEKNALPFDCADPVGSAPQVVKKALGPIFTIDASSDQLDAAASELRNLINATTNCRVQVQSTKGADKRNLAGEWMSLHSWITRLADFLYLNARGKDRVDWKREYEDFAALYEIEA